MTDLSHESCRNDLPLLASGDLSRERQQEVRAHIAECPSCHAEWQRGTTVLRELRAAGATPDSSSTAALEDFFERRIAPEVRARRRRGARVLGVVARAAVVLLAFSAGMLLERLTSTATPPASVPQPSPSQASRVDRTALDQAYEQSSRGQHGLARGLLALRSLRDS
ncbi:MAG: zf-HC2 domain-containing protein [Planctomycetota bacterium]